LKEAPQLFDVLVLDAFSSDSIPIHLLTQEAFEIYFRSLAPEGAWRCTSRTVTWIWPGVFGLAKAWNRSRADLHGRREHSAGRPGGSFCRETRDCWKCCAPTRHHRLSDPSPPLPVWTDQWHNLLEILQ